MAEGLRYEPSTPLGRLNIPNSGIRDIDSRPTVMGDKDYPAQAAATGGESVGRSKLSARALCRFRAVAGAAASGQSNWRRSGNQSRGQWWQTSGAPAGKDSARDKDEANRAVGHAATVPALSASSNEIVPADSGGRTPSQVSHRVVDDQSKVVGLWALSAAAARKHRGVSQWH